jgi:hypothetical protein
VDCMKAPKTLKWAPFQDIQDSQIPNPRAPDGEL